MNDAQHQTWGSENGVPPRPVDAAPEAWPVGGVAGDLDLRAVRYFAMVAQELHFGRAAARLDLSQSGLSRSISALENQLSVRLLTRFGRGVMLTPAGERLAIHGRSLLRLQADALADVRRAAHDHPVSARR